MQYIILDEHKRATHSFKDGKGTKTWKEAKDFDNIGLLVPEPFIILDFDTKSDSEIMLRIVEGLDLQCRVMETTRGFHFWFRSSEPWKCFKKTRLACGIYSDCKSHSKNAYVKIKDNGEMRKWVRKCELEDIEDVPEWLQPINAPSDKFNFKGMGDGDGRNQELFNYIVYLQTKGISKQGIKDCINVINNYVFEDAMPQYEIDTICRDEAFKSDEEIEKQIAERKSTFSFADFGDELIQEFNIKTLNGQMYLYKDGYYALDKNEIENTMLDRIKNLKQAQRSEVLSYIKIRTAIFSQDVKRDPYIINVKNTRLDIRTGNLLPFTPEVFDFDRIPVTYDPSAYSADLDTMLDRVFNCDKDVIALFEEMIGYCLIKHNDYQKAFMLYGSGSNGKSTIIALIKKFIGRDNYKTIELNKLTDKFATAELENKLANIGDDINSSAMKDTGTLKKLFSGDELLVERKGQTPFDLQPYATMIFSCNEIPRSSDKTDGLYRRWMFIPFTAKFTKDDAGFDPLIKEKILTDNSLSYMLNLAIKGARRLIENGGFTEPESVKEMLESYKTDNSSALSWIDDKAITEEYLLSKPCDEVYSDFCDWCKLSGIKNLTGKKAFFREVIQKYDFDEIRPQRRVNNVRKRFFSMKIE